MSQIQRAKAKLVRESIAKMEDSSFNQDCKILAEGDSWFDYPLVRDILDHLRLKGYAIIKCSQHGDTLENMIYGTATDVNKQNHTVKNLGPKNLKEVLKGIRKRKPKFFLFSGGGNDIVGEELVRYLNHVSHNKKVFKAAEFKSTLDDFMKPALEYYFKEIWKVDPNLQILMDGYDYAKPNGKGYKLAWIKLAGPWILPGFGSKGIVKKTDQEGIIKKLIDGFNSMLKSLDNSYPNFHHIDLRGMFPNGAQWHNEIHLKSGGFRDVSREYHKKIVSILGYNPLKQ